MKPRIFGLDTEYGILLKENDTFPRRYQALLQSNFNNPHHLSFLPNGGNIHVDNGAHPEYATAECRDILEVIAQEKAGELLLLQAFPEFRLFKNNIDSYGHGFGCHENYSCRMNYRSKRVRTLSRQNRIHAGLLLPFLVTRQIFGGTGHILQGSYHLSQRTSKLSSREGNDVRCIPFLFKQDHHLEIGLGDSTLSQAATYLKLGITGCFLDLWEEGLLPPILIPNWEKAFCKISADLSRKWIIDIEDEGTLKSVSVVDIQRRYYEAYQAALAKGYVPDDEVTRDVLGRWVFILDNIQKHPERLRKWVDHINKKMMLEELMDAEKLTLRNTFVNDVALQYHDADREEGLFYAGEKQGLSERLVDDDRIRRAMHFPPENTRAWFRGNVLLHHAKCVQMVHWFSLRVHSQLFNITNPFSTYEDYLQQIHNACKTYVETPQQAEQQVSKSVDSL